MKYAYTLAAASALAASAALFAPTASSAMPLGAPGAAPASDAMIIQAQSGHRVRSHRHGPRVVHRYHHRHGGWNRGAVIGGAAALGILGAAAAASAAPYYAGGCYIEQRPVYDAWGRYIGAQNVQVCP